MERVMEFAKAGAQLAVPAFVLSSMIAMGLGLSIGQIVAPLKNVGRVLLGLIANFVVMPAVAIGLAKLLRLDPQFGTGLLLLGAAAGAPFLPKLVQVAKGDLPFSVGLMVLLMVVTVGYLPVVLPMALPGVSVDPMGIAKSLVVLMLIPLAISLVVRARAQAFAEKIKPFFDKVSSLSLIALISLITIANFQNVLGVFGTRAILAALLFLAAGVGAGWILGGPTRDGRIVLALGTSQRNIAAALVVAGQSFEDPKVVVMVVVVAIAGLFLLFPAARAMAPKA
jgi:BASS family bile acid:Na+ symporter